MTNKVCVVDLDGTIWEEISEVVIVEKYYKTKKYTSLFGKIYGKIAFPRMIESLNRDFGAIPIEEVKKFRPNYKKKVLDLISNYKRNGYSVIIVSSAPAIVIDIAADHIQIPGVHVGIGKKAEYVVKKFGQIDHLITISDNLTDKDLFERSDESIVVTNQKKQRRFRRINFKGSVQYIEG